VKLNPWFLVHWFAESSLFKWISKHIIAHLHFRLMGYPKLPIGVYNSIDGGKGLADIVNENQHAVLFWSSSDSKSLASILIRWVTRSRFSHSGFVFMNEGKPTILHMKGKGLLMQDFLEILTEVDTFILKKVETKHIHLYARKIEELKSQVLKIKYDYAQKLGGKDMYCSELVWHVLNDLPDAPGIVIGRYLGRDAYSPEDVAKTGETLFSKLPEKSH
jgi:hypothetical protein